MQKQTESHISCLPIIKRQKTYQVYPIRIIYEILFQRTWFLQILKKTNQLLLIDQGPVVQDVVSLTSSLRVISLTVLADSIYNILIFFAEKNFDCKSYSHFFSKKFQHICVSLDVNFNESLTNNVVSFEQMGLAD